MSKAKKRTLLNQTAAAKVYGVKPRSVSYQCRPGYKLHPAVVVRNGRQMIDMDHPSALAYRAGKWADTVCAEPAPSPAPDHTDDEPRMRAHEIDPVIRKYLDYTVGEVVQKFGTMEAFSDLLSAAVKIESIHSKRLDSDRKTGELIERDYVRRHVLGLIERVFQRLLAEMPVRLSYEVHGMCTTAEPSPVEAVQAAIAAAVTRELRGLKKDTTKALNSAGD